MSIASPYLDGFLAAARPQERAANVAPPPSSVDVPATESTCSTVNPSFEETAKRRLHPLASYPRLLECASLNRPPDAEDCFRFQWFGLFYQAPAQDAFTLRLRLPGGRLWPFQLAGLAEITQRFAGGEVIFNRQGGLDVPGVPVTSAVDLLWAMERVGLSARRTGGDCVQAIRGGEYDDAGLDTGQAPLYPVVCALEQAVSYDPVLADLPRACEIILGSTEIVSSVDALVLRQMPGGREHDTDGGGLFLLLLPGQAADGFLLGPDQVVSSCLALLKNWAVGADRTSRESASLANYLATFEPEACCDLLGTTRRIQVPVPLASKVLRSGWTVPGARLLSRQLVVLEQRCRGNGWREIRLSNHQLHPIGPDGKWVKVEGNSLA